MQSWMIGMVSGIIFTGLWPFLPPWPVSLVLALFALVALCKRSAVARLVCGLACGCIVGLVYGTVLLHQRLADDCVGESLIVTGTVASLPRESPGFGNGRRQRFQFSVSDIAPLRCSGPTKLILSYYGDDTIEPGQRWQFEAKLKKPWGLANPGAFNMQVWFAQQGIDGVGSIAGAAVVQSLPPKGSLSSRHHRVRFAISKRIGALGLNPDVTAMLRALTVADKSGIEPHLWRLLQLFGINHLLVISGLHVGLVAGAGYLLGGLFARLIPGGTWVPGVMALVLAGLYGALAGFSLPTQRALVMLACFVGANLVGRKSGSANNLLLAATMVLIVNPLAAVGSGFWLSFGAVAALLWLARWQRGVGALWRLLSTHGFMALVMLPLGALFFGGASVVAMLANLLMIPLVGMVVVPLGLMAVVSFLCGWPMESTLWHLAAWPLQKLLPHASALAETGDSWMYLDLTAGLPQALLGLLAIALLIMPGTGTLKLPSGVLLLPLILPHALRLQTPSLDTRVTVLDVGQGTAVMVQSGTRALLYDTGGVNMASMVVLPYLQRQELTSLDTLVISHPDLDHSAGTADILDALPVERFRFGGADPGLSMGRSCIAGEAWRWPGGQTFQFLSPALESPPSSNDSSCVLQIQVGETRLLLLGDIEKEREQTLVRYWGDELKSDWLAAAHHGSRTSSSLTLLKQVMPTTVVISSGYANRFGHPHPDVIQRLQQRKVQIFRTATGGALEFDLAPGQALRVSAFRKLKRRYWM